MTANILSLSKARKAKSKLSDAKQAEQNRVIFGRTKAEKQIDKAEKSRLVSALNGAKRTPSNKTVQATPKENASD